MAKSNKSKKAKKVGDHAAPAPPAPPAETHTAKPKKPSWQSLPWRKVDLNTSNHTLKQRHGGGIGDNNHDDDTHDVDEFLNATNHYDDPDADGSDLYDTTRKTYADNSKTKGKKGAKPKGGGKRGRTDDDDAFVEGANDPGIIVGLEVIDGNQYMLEKTKVGRDESAGFVNRLVPNTSTKTAGQTNKPTKISKTTTTSANDNPSSNNNNNEEPTTRKKKKSKRKPKPPPPDKHSKTKIKPSTKSPLQKPNPNIIPSPTSDQITTLQTTWSHASSGASLHPALCAALHRLKFTSPTPIQAATLAASIMGRRDIVGAAPTGSGKTLSYLLPILQFMLYDLDDSAEDDVGQTEEDGDEGKEEVKVRHVHPLTALVLCPTRELALQVSKEFVNLLPPASPNSLYESIKCGCIVGGLSEHKQRRVLDRKRPPVIVGTPGRLWELMASGSHTHLQNLTKLRFLVIDEADRMISQGNFPQLTKIFEEIQKMDAEEEESLDGGVAEGQEYDADYEEGNALMGLPGVAKVTMLDDILKASGKTNIDDTEITHADEIDSTNIDGIEEEEQFEDDESDDARVYRQTFVYSATLTLPPSSDKLISATPKSSRKRKQRDSRKDVVTVDGAIAEILERAGALGETKIVNLATSTDHNPLSLQPSIRLPPGLSLHEVQCTQRHKDSHLYAYLTTTVQGSSGPCLVFCNSIGAVKRVGETLKVLGLPVRTLHAGMQQKARFTALESLKSKPSSIDDSNNESRGGGGRDIVVATDVAARGLDIPSVATIIHYDVPRTIDTFIHRAGRTARGMGIDAIGTSVSLVSAAESKEQTKICQAVLGGDKSHFNGVAIDGRMMTAAQARVNLASKIVVCEELTSRTNRNNKWFIDAAEDCELDLDDGMLDEGLAGGNKVERMQFLEARRAKGELKTLLAKPMRRQEFGKFLSGVGVSAAIRMEKEVTPFVVREATGGKKTKRRKR